MAIDEQHVALPKLYGAPAYARPPRPSADTPRPFDPDDLPIEAVRTDEERDLLPTVQSEGQGLTPVPTLTADLSVTTYLVPADLGLTGGATPTGPAPATATPASTTGTASGETTASPPPTSTPTSTAAPTTSP